MKYIVCLLAMLLSGCGVGLHIDNYGARLGKEQITVIENNSSKIYQIKFIGIGIFW